MEIKCIQEYDLGQELRQVRSVPVALSTRLRKYCWMLLKKFIFGSFGFGRAKVHTFSRVACAATGFCVGCRAVVTKKEEKAPRMDCRMPSERYNMNAIYSLPMK